MKLYHELKNIKSSPTDALYSILICTQDIYWTHCQWKWKKFQQKKKSITLKLIENRPMKIRGTIAKKNKKKHESEIIKISPLMLIFEFCFHKKTIYLYREVLIDIHVMWFSDWRESRKGLSSLTCQKAKKLKSKHSCQSASSQSYIHTSSSAFCLHFKWLKNTCCSWGWLLFHWQALRIVSVTVTDLNKTENLQLGRRKQGII